MAVNSCDEEKPYSQGIVDGSCNLPVSCSCCQLLKPHCSLDVLPVLFDEVSMPVRLKCPLHSSNGQDVYTISVLPADGTTNAHCESQFAFLSLLEVPNSFKSPMCLDDQLNCQDCIDLQTENADAYSPCTVDIDIETGNMEAPQTNEESIGSLKTECVLTNLQRVLRRQNSLQIGVKFMQLLIDYCLTLFKFTSRDKSAAERVHDTPNNRWRKYKRTNSFDSRKIDSRKIVLLFSVLSSMGTMVLIYLTLRVRQIGDGSLHV